MVRPLSSSLSRLLWAVAVGSLASCGGGEFSSPPEQTDASMDGAGQGGSSQGGSSQGGASQGGSAHGGAAGTAGNAGAPGAFNGTACNGDDECSSKHCVDNVCCDAECASSCFACTTAKKGAGVDGKCAAIGQGLDPDEECQAPVADSCSGTGACQCHDGVRDGDEAGVDCGGTTCQACVPCSGTCASGQVCFQEQCCTPDPNWCNGKCGSTTDNCGQAVNCGGCNPPSTCGGGNIPNVCGCSDPGSCEGKGCGQVTNLCGEQVSCGACGPGETCCADQLCKECCGSGVQQKCAGYNNPAECLVGICNYTGACSTRKCNELNHACACTEFPNCEGCF